MSEASASVDVAGGVVGSSGARAARPGRGDGPAGVAL